MVDVRLALPDSDETFLVNQFDPNDIGGFCNVLVAYGWEHCGFRYTMKGDPQFVTQADNGVALVFQMEEE